MVYLLILFPLAMAATAYAVPSSRWRPWLLPLGGLGNVVIAGAAIFLSAEGTVVSGLGGSLLLDALGKVVLGFISILFFFVRFIRRDIWPCALIGPTAFFAPAC